MRQATYIGGDNMTGAKQDIIYAAINNSQEGLKRAVDCLENDYEASICEIQLVQSKLQSAIGMIKNSKDYSKFQIDHWWAF